MRLVNQHLVCGTAQPHHPSACDGDRAPRDDPVPAYSSSLYITCIYNFCLSYVNLRQARLHPKPTRGWTQPSSGGPVACDGRRVDGPCVDAEGDVVVSGATAAPSPVYPAFQIIPRQSPGSPSSCFSTTAVHSSASRSRSPSLDIAGAGEQCRSAPYRRDHT
jgi:hypothetical protein